MTRCDTTARDEQSEWKHLQKQKCQDIESKLEELRQNIADLGLKRAVSKNIPKAITNLVDNHTTLTCEDDYCAALQSAAKMLDGSRDSDFDSIVTRYGLLILQTLSEKSGERLPSDAISPAIRLIEHSLIVQNDSNIVVQGLFCLELLSHRNTKDLVVFWPQLFAPGATLLLNHLGSMTSRDTARTVSVILQSGQKYWAMARESYSEQLASMLNEIRMQCQSLLYRADLDMIPLLSLVHTLFVTTDRVPLHKSHTEVFWQCIIHCAQRSKTSSEIVAVYDVLTLMEPAEKKLWPVAEQAKDQLIGLLDENRELPFSLHAHVWHILASMYERKFLKAPDRLALYISRDLSSESVEVRQSATEMLSCVVAQEGFSLNDTEARHRFRDLVVQASKDNSEMVRIALCGLWAKASGKLHANDSIESCPLQDLLGDKQPKVRSSAIRSIGICMERVCADNDLKEIAAVHKYYGIGMMISILFQDGKNGLIGDANLNTRVCTAWTLANWTVLLSFCPPTVLNGRKIVSSLLPLPRAEQVAVHLIRALGNMLALGVQKHWFGLNSAASADEYTRADSFMLVVADLSPNPDIIADNLTEKVCDEPSKETTPDSLLRTELNTNTPTHLYFEGIKALISVILHGRFAKIRWNAISSLVKSYRDALQSNLYNSALFWQGSILALCEALKDRILKIQRMAAEALVELIERQQTDIPRPVHRTLMENTQRAQSMLEERLQTASFGDAQMHGQACGQALEYLSSWLQTIHIENR